MTDLIQCEEHGSQEETYICQHLISSLKTNESVGFYWSSEPRGDAWCHACEKVRIAEGGIRGDWNERSEAFADIKILCGACYDRIRTQQQRTIF
jgi:hypothetical protein